jgi:hypothetical protein
LRSREALDNVYSRRRPSPIVSPSLLTPLAEPPQQPPNDRIVVLIQNTGPAVVFPGKAPGNLPGFIGVGWPQGQGDYFVVIRNTTRAFRLSSQSYPEQLPGLQRRTARPSSYAPVLQAVPRRFARLLRRQLDVVDAHGISAAAGVTPERIVAKRRECHAAKIILPLAKTTDGMA